METKENPTNKFYGLFQHVFDYYNEHLFGSAIKDCIIVITRRKGVMGHFSYRRWFSIEDKETDELAINPSKFLHYPLIEICQTIVHEMCHGWQYHYGKPSRAGYHNKEWSAKMQEVGLMPSSTGKPGGRNVGQRMSDYPLEGGPFLKVSEKLINGTVFEGLYLELNPSIIEGLDLEKPLFEQIKDVALVEPEDSPKPRKKTKYLCACTRVWGKPGLSLKCLDCGEEMREN